MDVVAVGSCCRVWGAEESIVARTASERQCLRDDVVPGNQPGVGARSPSTLGRDSRLQMSHDSPMSAREWKTIKVCEGKESAGFAGGCKC